MTKEQRPEPIPGPGEEISLGDAQKLTDRWIREIGGRYFSELTNMVILTEEVGELARIVARVYGEQKAKPGDLSDPRKAIEEELADVLWVVVCLANQTGTDLTQAFRKTLEKKYSRDRFRFRENPDKEGNGRGATD